MNHYLMVFIESCWSASIIPFSQNPTFFALQAFGGHNMALAYALAVAGSMLGLFFNWEIGKFLLSLQDKNRIHLDPALHAKGSRIFNRYLLFLLLLTWNSMLNYISVLAAFLRVPFRIGFPLMLVGQAGYYAYQLMY